MKNTTNRNELEILIKETIKDLFEESLNENLEGEQLINLFYQIEDNTIWYEQTGIAYSGNADDVEELGQLIINNDEENGIITINTDNIRF